MYLKTGYTPPFEGDDDSDDNPLRHPNRIDRDQLMWVLREILDVYN